MRTFFGIPVDAEILECCKDLIVKQCPNISEQYRWIKPENCHITMRFLGDVERTKVDEIITTVTQSLQNQHRFPVSLEKIDLFPPRLDRIIGVYAAISEPILATALAMERALSLLDFPKEPHAFQPHITFLRKRARRGHFHFEPIFLKQKIIMVNKIVLFQSQLQNEGSVYTALHEFILQ